MRWPMLLAALILAAVPLPQAQAGDAPAPAVNAEAEVLRLYDLTDLLETPRDFPALELLNGSVTGQFTPAPAKPDAEKVPKVDALLRSFFAPAIVDLLSGKCVLHNGSTLFVTASAALHHHIDLTLASSRRQRNLQIHTHCSLFVMDPQHRQVRYALPGFHWRPLPGDAEAAIAHLTPSENNTLIGLLGNDKQVHKVTSPGLTAFAGQLANISNIKQYAYLTPAFTPKGPELRSSILTFGDAYAVRATPIPDSTFIHLELTQKRVELLEIKTVPWEGVEDRLKPHIPVTATSSIHIDQAVASEHSLVVATSTFLFEKDQPRAGFLLIECTLLDEAAREQQTKAFQERKAELKAALSGADAETKEAQQKETAPPVTKGADNF